MVLIGIPFPIVERFLTPDTIYLKVKMPIQVFKNFESISYVTFFWGEIDHFIQVLKFIGLNWFMVLSCGLFY